MSTNQVQFVAALSACILWPVRFGLPQEDGPEIEAVWMFRFKRPNAADSKAYRDAKVARLDREIRDRMESQVAPLRGLDAASLQMVAASGMVSTELLVEAAKPAPDKVLTDEERAARLDGIFSVAVWREKFWKGWKAQSLTGTEGQVLDPDSAVDRAYILSIMGVEAAIDRALDEMLTGGRQKNSQPPLAS